MASISNAREFLSGSGMGSAKGRRAIMRIATPYILIAPVIIYYAFFWIRPVLRLVADSFSTLEGGFTFGNFQLVVEDPSFWPAVLNTAVIVIISVSLEFVLALALAFLINAKFPGIPMALPMVALAAAWQTGFTAHGWVNSLLIYLGILAEGEKIYYLTGSHAQNLALIILIDAWTVIPGMMIILLAGMQNLPEDVKEAGYVFGGNWWTVTRKITVPMLKATITTAVILRLISAIQIWLIVVVLFGFNRLPVLVERVVYFADEVSGLYNSSQMAAAYTIIVSFMVSVAAIVFLQVSGAFKRAGEEIG